MPQEDRFLYVFDTSSGVAGAPCFARIPAPTPTKRIVDPDDVELAAKEKREPRKIRVPDPDAPMPDVAAITEKETAVGVIAQDQGVPYQALRLNADAETFQVSDGFDRRDELAVQGLRGEIDSKLIDALLAVVLDFARSIDPADLRPESVAILQRLEPLQQLAGQVESAGDLDGVAARVAEFQRIQAARQGR